MKQTRPLTSHAALAHELLIDAHGCDALALTSTERMRNLCTALVEVLGVTVLGTPMMHVFPATEHGAGGLTAIYLLSESHLALHTWPERRALLLSVCCCRPLPTDPVVLPLLRTLAGAYSVSTNRIERGRIERGRIERGRIERGRIEQGRIERGLP